MSNSKSVAKKEEKSTALAAPDYGEYKGEGFEGTTASDLSIPFISVLQNNSPIVEDNPEAEAGMLYNTVTGELIDGEDGTIFQPCYKERLYTEWVPYDDGGGFVGIHTPDSDIVKNALVVVEGNKFADLKNGENDLVETHYVYGNLLDKDGKEVVAFAVMAMTSTKIKVCRDWFTSMYMIKGQPPLFANRARLQTVKQKKDKFTFYNFKITPIGNSWAESLIDPKSEDGKALLQAGKEFKDMVTSGIAKAAFETQESASGGSAAAAGEGDTPF